MKYNIIRQPGGFARISNDFSGLNYSNLTGLAVGSARPGRRYVLPTGTVAAPVQSTRPAPTPRPSSGNIISPSPSPAPPSNIPAPYNPAINPPASTMPVPSDLSTPIGAPTGGGGGGGSAPSGESESAPDSSAAKGVGGGIFRKSCIPHYVLAAIIGGLSGHYAAQHYKKNVWGGTLIGGAALTGGMIWWCYKYHNDAPALAPVKS